MKTSVKIALIVTSTLAVGGIVYFVINQAKKKKIDETTVTEEAGKEIVGIVTTEATTK